MDKTGNEPDRDDAWMAIAARLAWRGHGGAAPNPMVGCVLVDPQSDDLLGWGYHRQCGGPHAEVHALRRAGSSARGATAYVTLEPCARAGRTGPCADALINAGVARVVVARRDPHPQFAGGIDRLETAGIPVSVLPARDHLLAPSDPFVHRVQTGRPWVVAKWAQTLDGRVATRTGASQWISSRRSRRMVHRARGRVDAILVGVGTARADDPMLTARGVRVRRVARRVVIDRDLELTPTSKLATTARDVPTIVICGADAAAARDRAEPLTAKGVIIETAPRCGDRLDLAAGLRTLAEKHAVATMLVEAGPRLNGALLEAGLVNEAWVFVAPLLLADEHAVPAVTGHIAPALTDGTSMRLLDVRRRQDDLVLYYRPLP